jgi:methyl-accepting chemotaxis protein PixJ
MKNQLSFLQDTLSNIPEQQSQSLRSRLMLTVLPVVIIPLAIASTIGFNLVEQKQRDRALLELKTSSILASNTATIFIKNFFIIPELVNNNTAVIKALQSGAKKAEERGLTEQAIDRVEQQFKDTKLLELDLELNTYLQRTVKQAKIAEMFFTDRHGFNIAYSNPTSDFVQNDEKWWQDSYKNGYFIGNPEFDDSANAVIVALAKAMKNPSTGEFLGVIKTAVPVTELNENINTYVSTGMTASQQLQLIDLDSGMPINTITAKGIAAKQDNIVGGKPIFKVAKAIQNLLKNNSVISAQIIQQLQTTHGITKLKILNSSVKEKSSKVAEFEYQGKLYSLALVPETNWIAIASIDRSEITTISRQLLAVFALTALVLGAVAIGAIALLANRLSQPLASLTKKAQLVAQGNLDVRADLQGTMEVVTLAQSFNNLVAKVKELIQQQEMTTSEQRQGKEAIEEAIFQLVYELEGAGNGDLTVRASLTSEEMSTVADLINAIIENLQDIAIEVKESSIEVSSSLEENEQSIQKLARQVISETEEIKKTLNSVEQMSLSIRQVSDNANQTATIADETYQTIQMGSSVMEQTVDSIVQLRTNVAETVKKMKRLGESSQKISQVVALIDEIALKTNLLAINASVEARRAGEQGQGFTSIAEQIGALAEQSAAATKEIDRIVTSIQSETKDVANTMELSTTQVADSTRLVEATKHSLGEILEKSEEINQLMQSISSATVTQVETSEAVNNLMQKVTQSSQERAISSYQVAQAIQSTAQVAKNLESKVSQFKVSS